MAGVVPIPMLVPRSSAALSTVGPADSDDALMCRVRQGEVSELSLLFERHQAPLLNFFLRLGSPRASAEDLVQDVFVRILKYRATYRPGSKFTTWLYYIARNVRLDHLHKRRGEVEWDDAYTPGFVPNDAAQSGQEQELLARALQRLPAEKREILILSRFQELRYEEIGALLDCETGTVKVRVHRALRELREQYQFLARRRNDEGGAA
ncbi:MAG: RNA polymerase sigma factor [Terriglobales bacterium]